MASFFLLIFLIYAQLQLAFNYIGLTIWQKFDVSAFGVIIYNPKSNYIMKILFSLIAIIWFTECGERTSTETSNEPIDTQIPMTVQQEDTTIVYEATTRGFYEKIWVNKDSISVTNDRNAAEISRVSTPKSKWNELIKILDEVNLSTLPDLEAPTSTREYDGAAIATLSVTKNEQETKSNSFDHGHPPKAIEALVNNVLSLGAVVKKQ